MDSRFGKVDRRLEQLADSIRDTKSSILKWMFGFWIGTALAVAGSRLVL
jgi:hypothetical protein